MVFEKGTSGYLGITSSIYLNWNIYVVYFRIDIKLVLIKAEWWWLLFRKNIFRRHFRSRRHDVIKISIADIFFILLWIEPQFGQSGLGSPCDFEVISNIMWPWRSPWHWGQWQGQCIFFLYCLICQIITPWILDHVSWNFKLSSLKNGSSGFGGITSSIYLNWNIFVPYCQIEIKLVLVKAEWWWLSFLKKYFSMSLPVSQTWRHWSFNCGYLSYFTLD